MINAYDRYKILFFSILLTAIVCICLSVLIHPQQPQTREYLVPTTHFDLDAIKKRGKLIALTDNSSTSFYIYKGDSLGYEYELLRAFADKMNVDLQLVIAKDMNGIFDQLNNGDVDIIAANLTVTADRLNLVDFTDPLMLMPQVLVQRKPAGWENMTKDELNSRLIRNTIDLSGKQIHVRKASSFYSRLMSLSEEIGEKINIVEVPGDVETEELIEKVANGEIEYTIADENVAMSNQTYYANIDVGTPISFPQKIAWAVRKGSPQLLSVLNEWMAQRKDSKENQRLYAKYFKAKKKGGGNSGGTYVSYSSGIISNYDELIQTYSEKVGWDWRLLAAMIYQESHFSPTARSWSGANGFMQLVPATAKHYGLDTLDATAEQSIKAGTSYILDIDNYWKGKISDKTERTKFVLASYNVGLGHVIDARNLAIKHGLNPNIWFDNVESMILQKSNPQYYNDPVVKCGYCRGQEPYFYVREILARYEQYKKIPAKVEVVKN